MAKDPKYVRLPDRLVGGIVADVLGNSDWSIGGNDVRKFPEDDEFAAEFVRSQLRNGNLEPASKAEWEELHPESSEDDQNARAFVEAVNRAVQGPQIQEAHIQRSARAARQRLQAARSEEDGETVPDDEVDTAGGAQSPGSDYSNLPKRQLVQLAGDRGLSTDGNVSDLRERLLQDDERLASQSSGSDGSEEDEE